jgi:hypothetical protein
VVGGWAVQTGRMSWSALTGDSGDGPGDEAGRAPERALPGVDLTNPFDGTPAASYAESVAGIEVPAATAVGRYDADRVGRAFAAVTRVVQLSRLDPAMLTDGDPSAYLAALSPVARARVEPAFTGGGKEALSYGTRLASGQRLLATPRVRGTLRAELGERDELVVVADYLVVYPLAPPAPVSDRADTHALTRAEATFAFYDERWPEESRGVWPLRSKGYTYQMDCAQLARGLLALAPPASANAAARAGSRDDYYGLDAPLDAPQDC